jgi:pimeloyl-ACP methyl ester carboxylesterase
MGAMSEQAAGGSHPTVPGAAEVRTILVDGRRVRYAVGGRGRPLLLLHGIARSLEDWNEARVDLETRHTVYAIDLPGFGGSERLDGTSELPAFGRSVLSFLDAVDVREPVRIVGNSLGGAVALQAVALAPDRFAALVLVDSAGFGSEVAAELRALALPGVSRLLARPSRRLARRQVQGIFHDPAQVTEERIELAYELAARAGSAEVLLEVGRSLGNLRGVRPEWRRNLLDQVRELDIPVLLLWGENDRVLPVRHLRAAHQAFPAARSHVFPATGHMPQIERPAEFGEILTGFFEGVEG